MMYFGDFYESDGFSNIKNKKVAMQIHKFNFT